MCGPMVLADKSLSCVQKFGQHFMLANEQIVRCDWLAVINIMAAVPCVDHTNYTSLFHLCIVRECIQTDFGCLRFRLRAAKQITAAAMSSAEYSISAIFNCCPTKCCCVGQQMLDNICCSCVRGIRVFTVMMIVTLQCFSAVAWITGRTSGL